jgi:ribonuclease P protein component
VPDTGTYTFPRAVRLLHRHDYARVFAQALKSADGYLTVLACRNEGISPRLGLVIAKKRVRLAVQRNRLKRLARESFRLHQATLAPLDIIILARDAAAQAPNAALLGSLQRHWQRLNKLCAESSCS